MKHLKRHISDVSQLIRGKDIFLMLDYDGTLVELSPVPDEARLSECRRESLVRLARKAGLAMAIISGRELSDIKAKVGLQGIVYSGNHGSSLEGPDMVMRRRVTARYTVLLESLSVELRRLLHKVEGIHFEQKTDSLAIHFRRCEHSDAEYVRRVVMMAANAAVSSGDMVIYDSNMTLLSLIHI